MNAFERGKEYGFAARIQHISATKERFQNLGEITAKRAYKSEQKQSEYLKGWMENWREPHAKDCTCSDCKFIREEIQTY